MRRQKKFLAWVVFATLFGVGFHAAPVDAAVTVSGGSGESQTLSEAEYAVLDAGAYTGSSGGNTLDASDAKVSGTVYGGFTENDSADGNTVSLKNTSAASVWGGKAGTYTDSINMDYVVTGGSANGNTVTIGQGSIGQKIVGGEAAAKSANGNSVTIEGAVIGGAGQSAYEKAEVHPTSAKIASDLIAGGISTDGDTNQNVVKVTGSEIKSKYMAIFGGLSDASAKGNKVTLSLNTSSDTQLYLIGGSAINGTAEGNIVDVTDTGSGLFQTITGGTSWPHPDDLTEMPDGDEAAYGAKNNKVHLKGVHVAPLTTSTFSSGVYGGYSFWGKVEGNSVSMEDSKASSVSGGYSMMGCTSGNTVEISSSEIRAITGNTDDGTAGLVFGGLSGNGRAADDNRVTLSGGTKAKGVYGGVGQIGSAKGNIVTITDSSVELEAVGGETGDMVGWITQPGQPKDAENNQVIVNGSSTIGTVVGGEAAAANTFDEEYNEVQTSGKSSGNTVTINDGTVKNSVLGGHSALSDATGNTVNIAGGTIGTESSGTGEADDNAIAGGFAEEGQANDNTVNITGGTLGAMMSLYGGYSEKGSSGNTLNLHTKGNTVKNLGYFQNLNFYVPEGTAAGETMVTVTGNADVSKAAIQAGIEKTTKLAPGQAINLIYDAGGIKTDGTSYSMMSGKDIVSDAGFVDRKAAVKKQDDNTIVVYVPKDEKGTIHPDTKIIPEDRENGINTIKNAGDLVSNAAEGAWKEDHDVDAKFVPYAIVGGYDLHYNTGSYIDSNGMAANVGLIRRIRRDGAIDTVMPFLEYGRSNYASFLDDGARGDGRQHYTGGGVLLRRDLDDGKYYEGAIRAGRLKGDFHGIIDSTALRYDSSAPYVAAQAGAGKIYAKDRDTYDLYGEFFWTHLGSDTATIRNSRGEAKYEFDDINSYRTRLGLRWTRNFDKVRSLYAGIGWDYEFDSKARAFYDAYRTDTPTVKGSSEFLELGWKSKVTSDHPWGVDLKATGWTGKQEGGTLFATVSRSF
ncbi:MAG TPA: hypothetical protein OIM03_00850 [Veillonellaceae bacterium]|nr:hypothetical protein [Veillonellaceae bacterium]